MRRLRNVIGGAVVGATLGALILGLGGRIMMRLLAVMIERDPAFSLGGSLEVVAYGAIVGAVSGAVFALLRPIMSWGWLTQGILLATLTYFGTIATLPAHIAETARPFAGQMPFVLLLFGLCFTAFGLTMARVSSRGSNPAPEAAPIAPRE